MIYGFKDNKEKVEIGGSDFPAVMKDENGNISVEGGITAKSHAQRIGYMPSFVDEAYVLTSGTSWVNTGIGFTLDPGTWVLIADVRFPAESRGFRGAAWGIDNDTLNVTMVRTKALGSGFRDQLQTVAIVQPSTQKSVTVRAQQSSTDSMSVNITARAVRIE